MYEKINAKNQIACYCYKGFKVMIHKLRKIGTKNKYYAISLDIGVVYNICLERLLSFLEYDLDIKGA